MKWGSAQTLCTLGFLLCLTAARPLFATDTNTASAEVIATNRDFDLHMKRLMASRPLLPAHTNAVSARGTKDNAFDLQMRLGSIFSPHTNAAWNLGESNLLTLTVVRNNGRVWYLYTVKEDGAEMDHRMTPYAAEDSKWKMLSGMDITNLHTAIEELPTESASPPLDRTVLVSFKSGTNWINRTYDFDQRPKALYRIHEIIGERWEMKRPMP